MARCCACVVVGAVLGTALFFTGAAAVAYFGVTRH